ncbi:MAG: tetratricopeptide repeat protein [Massilia sp.]
MSLLNQALKKAERARQHHEAEEHAAKPSEAFDDMLDLAPSNARPSASGRSAYADEPPLCALRLSPLEPPLAPEDEPAPPQPAAHGAPPAARIAVAIHPDARTIRLLSLLGVLLLIAAVFGYMVWRAMYGPGSSRQLPMVPMPGPNGVAQTAPPLISTVPPPDLSQPAPDPAAPAGGPAFNAPEPGAVGAINPPPPPLSDAEEVRRIAQENLERADRMDRVLNMSNPVARPPAAPALASPPASVSVLATAAPANGPPNVQPYVPPVVAYASVDSAPIKVAHASKPAQVDPALTQAYSAFNSGDYAGARRHYQDVIARDAANRDALLGLAALAVHERQGEQAAAIYSRLLAADPADGDAVAGLASLRQGDAQQSESRLRALLARAPESAPALFALGNLYARQGRWQEAQQEYFKAYSAAPDNPDYAFNLAVGLDRLGQPALALTYYEKALAGAGATFDTTAARARLDQLKRR